jgi:hypothetical protein
MMETDSQRLYWLLRSYCEGNIDSKSFCDAFEMAFNYEVDKSQLSAREHAIFKALFDEVVYFSPFPEEIKIFPLYRSSAQIGIAARKAQEELASKNSN